MKLIIDIDEKDYANIKDCPTDYEYSVALMAIANGIPYKPKVEWINQFIGGNECVMCSECKLHFDIGTYFCPNCGADMKGGAV